MVADGAAVVSGFSPLPRVSESSARSSSFSRAARTEPSLFQLGHLCLDKAPMEGPILRSPHGLFLDIFADARYFSLNVPSAVSTLVCRVILVGRQTLDAA